MNLRRVTKKVIVFCLTVMTRNKEVQQDLFLDDILSAEIAENFLQLFPEHSDLSYEEVLRQQEIVYQSLMGNDKNKRWGSDHSQSSNWSQFSGQEGESSLVRTSVELQLALDEALARSLQELGDDFNDLYISESPGNTEVDSRGSPVNSMGTPVRFVSPELRHDDIDPDDMTYEQLQRLGDSIGVESKGLSAEHISTLPSFKYKTGFFSKKDKNEECCICCMKYETGVYLTTLPCTHKYHSECIERWLKMNKNCPVCQQEVSQC